MGIMIYRDDSWSRAECGCISRGDIMGLDRKLDRWLIEYLILHASEQIAKRAMRKYGIDEMPEERINVDDPDDEIYRTYFVLREQAEREDDCDVLRDHAFRRRNDDMSRFAFCRLTGFSWPSDECDAYSYRTYCCGLKSDIFREDIEDLCREMTEQDGPFAAEAKEWLAKLPDISDETLDEWASAKTERREYLNPHEALTALLAPSDGSTDLSEEELHQKMRGAADAWILMNYEEKCGKLSRRRYLEITDPFIRGVREVLGQFIRDMIPDTAEAVKAVLITGRAMPRDLTREKIIEIIRSNEDDDPLHAYYRELAEKYSID